MHASAPAWMTRRVREIDPDLSVVWLTHEGKYAVVQKLYNTPSVEDMTDHVARELYADLCKKGYEPEMATCQALAYPTVCNESIVLRIEDRDTGESIPLDERTLAPLRRMAWLRRRCAAKDYIAIADQEMYEAQRSRQRAIENVYSSIRRDKVFAKTISDILSGVKTRSVDMGTVEGEVPTA